MIEGEPVSCMVCTIQGSPIFSVRQATNNRNNIVALAKLIASVSCLITKDDSFEFINEGCTYAVVVCSIINASQKLFVACGSPGTGTTNVHMFTMAALVGNVLSVHCDALLSRVIQFCDHKSAFELNGSTFSSSVAGNGGGYGDEDDDGDLLDAVFGFESAEREFMSHIEDHFVRRAVASSTAGLIESWFEPLTSLEYSCPFDGMTVHLVQAATADTEAALTTIRPADIRLSQLFAVRLGSMSACSESAGISSAEPRLSDSALQLLRLFCAKTAAAAAGSGETDGAQIQRDQRQRCIDSTRVMALSAGSGGGRDTVLLASRCSESFIVAVSLPPVQSSSDDDDSKAKSSPTAPTFLVTSLDDSAHLLPPNAFPERAIAADKQTTTAADSAVLCAAVDAVLRPPATTIGEEMMATSNSSSDSNVLRPVPPPPNNRPQHTHSIPPRVVVESAAGIQAVISPSDQPSTLAAAPPPPAHPPAMTARPGRSLRVASSVVS